MSAYLVEGGNRLQGTARVHGAKNSVLPILAATILCPGESVVHNCPDLSDVRASIAILEHLGCRVERAGDTVTVDASALTGRDVPDALMREMRSSVIFLGAILARLGEAVMSFPGGCELGPRPIDLHLAAIRSLGAQVREQGGELHCSAAGGLAGCEITFSIPSVGATENAMLCACGAEGVTVICNAAREPEIVDLQAFLRALGADVRGAGTSVITVRGKKPLHGGEHTVMPDRIVAATLLTAVAAAGGEAELLGTDYRQLSTVTAVLTEAGCRIRSGSDSIHICREAPLRGVRPIRTAPYPGFPTDAQPPVMAALCRGTGTTVFVENMFESRYRHVDELSRMGADIRVEGKVAVVCGVERLHGAALQAADLRGGAALVVAALGAEGRSEITGLHHMDRGYYGLEDTLRGLGADIVRVP
ncbi:UDP-N-acetylglucosamine 1-carboxyvinyltransferase [Intestinimonas massiliensis]|uniref:UDP-N-acetylglucosamine 1-carboxyvinyltransferase n=1 Tax=Intestinimonas massiliensis (ex Afouda et al. 2020) TaxID=1673721 RepID=A0ABS9M9A8_9FIRM|nr:UDP-N-acetylglucosamine 1-carboxyvinyltransferase [Intestinimonas massiliensis (ex Afouda et al. 2020)]MCG4527397.1 UDP-N-acetylglucosamine 1-carboxyvinyltransferase [Intestinimonas massiliensis (ex Afouda et al. 2020)]MCQ4805250.1 UDP-N-acetylglucosamine 1-carboxyvinyltransferase [Intestinimonas massiliensis (ex Afouda et al. 2020)]